MSKCSIWDAIPGKVQGFNKFALAKTVDKCYIISLVYDSILYIK